MAKLLLIVLSSAILMGLFPISHPMSAMPTMRAMQMDEMTLSDQNNMEHERAGENSAGSCCDEIASFAIGCSFLVPQYAFNDLAEGGTHVISLNPVFRFVYIETSTPPPKA